MQASKTPSLAETYASDALECPWPAGAWPGEIGQRLILQQNVRRGWYHRPVIDYQTIPQAPKHRGHGLSIGWRRLPSEGERSYPGGQAFDRNGHRLAAAHAAMLPMGMPEWVAGAQYYKVEGVAARVGLWQVDVDYADSPWNGYDLPAVCPEGVVWLWTPSLHAAVRCGYLVGPVLGGGAILWSEQPKRLLLTWAERIWAARRALEQNADDPERWPIDAARCDAIALVKQLYVQTIGAFGHEPGEFAGTTEQERAADIGRTREMEPWQRPEWFCTILAEEVAYGFAVMRKAVERGCPPLWARLDTLGFVAVCEGLPDRESWPSDTARDAGLYTKPGGLGAWRYDYSLPMSELLITRGHDVEIPGRAERARLPAVRVR